MIDNGSISIDTHIDTLGIRCECDNKSQRDNLFNVIIDFLIEKKIVAIKYNEKGSSPYYQITELLYGNTKLASMAKGYYINDTSFDLDYYYINISFYGLKRYNKIKDNASSILIRNITAFLNTNNIYFRLIELDIAMDIESKLDNLLAICTRRTANVNYFELGDIDGVGSPIQKDDGTYYIEKFNTYKQKKNAMSRAYLYNKRQKERNKFKRDIGFELTRFELKLQKRFFVKNEFNGSFLYKAIGKYSILYFEDKEQKKFFIQQYNIANTSRKRRRVVDEVLKTNNAVLLTPRLNSVYSFLRDIDSVVLDIQGDFKYIKHKDYLYCKSKFNYKGY